MQGAVQDGLRGRRVPRGRGRGARPRGTGETCGRRHGAGDRHGRQRRDRDPSAHKGGRRIGAQPRRPVPHRRHRRGGPGAARREEAGRRPNDPEQQRRLRPQGRRRPLREEGSEGQAPHDRRGPGERHTLRNGERPRHRGDGRGCKAR